MNYQDKVAQFMRISGQLVATEPRELTKEELDFRDTLLREEIRELQYAIVDNNRVEILDALCDIKYVNDGTANMIGYKQWDIPYYSCYGEHLFESDNVALKSYLDSLQGYDSSCISESVDDINDCVIVLACLFGFSLKNFKTALDRVHASNLSKFCLDTKTVEKTQEFYSKQGIRTYVEPREKVMIVYREGDGKVLKSVNFWAPYLEDLV